MKLIIAGSRSITDPAPLAAIMAAVVPQLGAPLTEIVSGTAPGVDRLGEAWARAHGVPVVRFPADWHRYSSAAGPIRNRQMACYADACVLLWDGHSRGTLDMWLAMAAAHHPNPRTWRYIWEHGQWRPGYAPAVPEGATP